MKPFGYYVPFIIFWMWVVLIILAIVLLFAHHAAAQPAIPKAPIRPILAPKQAGQQSGRTMAKSSLVVNVGALPLVVTNHVQIGGLLAYSNYVFIVERSTNAAGPWTDAATFNNSNTPPAWDDTNAPNPAYYRGVSLPGTNNP